MNTFGNIKSKIEKATVGLYGKPQFKSFMTQFKKIVLENKDMSELYLIYDDLSSNKSLSSDIADEYITESIEYAQILIENNEQRIRLAENWINRIVNSSKNGYKDIDTMIYLDSIRNLETVLESKRKIKNTITESKKVDKFNQVNVPISSMVKIANSTLNKNFSNLSESERKELNSIVNLTPNEIKKEMGNLKNEVISKLKFSLNESTDSDLKDTINNTINKIKESKNDFYNLYKLRNLNAGL